MREQRGREAGTSSRLEQSDVTRRLDTISKVVLVGSGKGGVGKTTISCGLAATLAGAGLSTAVLDLDLHGPSVPECLGTGPPVKSSERGLEPKEVGGVKVMSLGLFTGENPLPIRGQDKGELIAQFFASTNWGELDRLVVDLPPTLGDEMLAAFELFSSRSSLVLVTTPAPPALRIVSMLRSLADKEREKVAGAVVNMAYLRENGTMTYPFGRVRAETLEKKLKARVLAKVPLEPAVASRGLLRAMDASEGLRSAFLRLAHEL